VAGGVWGWRRLSRRVAEVRASLDAAAPAARAG
jgi:hypothetical protein